MRGVGTGIGHRELAGIAITAPSNQFDSVLTSDVEAVRSTLGPEPSYYQGVIWSPNHGDVAFIAPLFDALMQGIMQDNDWDAG